MTGGGGTFLPWVAALALCACGSSAADSLSPPVTSVMGTVEGNPFAGTTAFAVLENDTKGQYPPSLEIYVLQAPATCEDAFGFHANATELHLYIFSSASPDAPRPFTPIVPGTYEVPDPASTATSPFFPAAVIDRFDAAGKIDVFNEWGTGTLVIDQLSGPIRGSVDATFDSGDHVSGPFVATRCASTVPPTPDGGP